MPVGPCLKSDRPDFLSIDYVDAGSYQKADLDLMLSGYDFQIFRIEMSGSLYRQPRAERITLYILFFSDKRTDGADAERGLPVGGQVLSVDIFACNAKRGIHMPGDIEKIFVLFVSFFSKNFNEFSSGDLSL